MVCVQDGEIGLVHIIASLCYGEWGCMPACHLLIEQHIHRSFCLWGFGNEWMAAHYLCLTSKYIGFARVLISGSIVSSKRFPVEVDRWWNIRLKKRSDGRVGLMAANFKCSATSAGWVIRKRSSLKTFCRWRWIGGYFSLFQWKLSDKEFLAAVSKKFDK